VQEPSVSGQQQLADLLRQIQHKRQSGDIYYVVRDGSSGKIKVIQGVLCDITYQNKPISTSDVVDFDLNTPVLIPRTTEKQQAPSPGIPDLASFIVALETHGGKTQSVREPPQPEESPQEDSAHPQVDLPGAAKQILIELYGVERASKQVTKVAGQWPPEQHPQQFLDKCRELVALTLGPEAAEEIFTPLYEKVNVR
jgi:hypothetical protein